MYSAKPSDWLKLYVPHNEHLINLYWFLFLFSVLYCLWGKSPVTVALVQSIFFFNPPKPWHILTFTTEQSQLQTNIFVQLKILSSFPDLFTYANKVLSSEKNNLSNCRHFQHSFALIKALFTNLKMQLADETLTEATSFEISVTG